MAVIQKNTISQTDAERYNLFRSDSDDLAALIFGSNFEVLKWAAVFEHFNEKSAVDVDLCGFNSCAAARREMLIHSHSHSHTSP